jgi:ATP-dependent Clp protease adaptor protein ClpS
MEQTTVSTEINVKVKNKSKLNIQEPPLFKVIYINDELTTVEFVIESLKAIFQYTEEEAEALTHVIHEEGSAVVAVYPYELAEQKGIEATMLARSNGFPLQIKLEADA